MALAAVVVQRRDELLEAQIVLGEPRSLGLERPASATPAPGTARGSPRGRPPASAR